MNALTRKAGPLPVWAWGALAFAAWFLFLRGAPKAQSAQLPFVPAQRPSTQLPASGQGTPADNGNADLIAALGQQASSTDALLAALQANSTGGYGSSSPAGGTSDAAAAPLATAAVTGQPSFAGTAATAPTTGGASDGTTPTDATTAPTITTQENNAPVVEPAGTYVGTSTVQTSVGPVSYSGYTQDPATVDASGGYASGVVPAATYVIGGGGGNSVDPILESVAVPTTISTPAYSPNPDNVQNAQAVAQRTGRSVAI